MGGSDMLLDTLAIKNGPDSFYAKMARGERRAQEKWRKWLTSPKSISLIALQVVAVFGLFCASITAAVNAPLSFAPALGTIFINITLMIVLIAIGLIQIEKYAKILRQENIRA